MIHRTVRVTAWALAAAIFFAGSNITVQAAGISSVLPNSGVNITLAKGTTLETLQEQMGDTTAKIEAILDRAAIEQARKEAGLAEQAQEDEELKSLVIAQVNNYVNVRSIPSEEGEILGKLYNNSVGTFISEENGWYQITSGSVTGYVKAEYCVTGDAAISLAKEVSTRIAKVNTVTLKVRSEATTESSCIGTVGNGDDLVVYEEVEGWVKVDTEEGMGWVSTDYVILSREFVQAESREEEENRLAKEAEERRKAHEAAQAKAKEKAQAQAEQAAQSGQTAAPAPVVSSDGSDMGKAVADYALQFVGKPYKFGGSSLTEGTDCSGFVMSVYANFGVSLPHSSSADRSQGSAVDGLANAQPGDLVCYSGHVALYIGNGQIVHASTPRTGIITSSADYKKVLAVRRIF